MASAGIELKKLLGLDAYKSVLISRVINHPLKLYFIWYDSLTSIAVNQQRVLKSHRPATLIAGLKLKTGGRVSHPKLTTPVDLNYYSGQISDSHFILVDMAGDWLPRGKKISVRYEGEERPEIMVDLDELAPTLVELDEGRHQGFTVWNLANQAPSRRNKFFYQARKTGGRTGSFIKEAYFKDNDVGKALVLKFRVTPTFGDGVTTHKVGAKRVKTMDLGSRVRWSSYYTVWVLFEMLEDDLTEEQLQIMRAGTASQRQSVIREIFRKSTAKIHSNDMSYYWQGCWESAAELGYSIFPFTGRHGRGIWARKHTGESPGIYITKHILEVMKVLPFNANTVARIMQVKEGSHGTNPGVRPVGTGDAETATPG